MQVVFDPIDVSHEGLIHVSTRRRVTRQEYGAFCAANHDLRIERSPEGELIVIPPAHSRTGNQNAQLNVWAIRNGGGVAFDSSAGFDLSDGSNRCPMRRGS
jgi:Uma2 family endonuclease